MPGITQKAIAALLGMSRSNVAHYERGAVKAAMGLFTPAADLDDMREAGILVSVTTYKPSKETLKALGEMAKAAKKMKANRSKARGQY